MTVAHRLPHDSYREGAYADLRSRFEDVVGALALESKMRAVGLRFHWSARLSPVVDVDGDELAWVARYLVGYALRLVRSGCATSPGGNVGLNVDVGDVAGTFSVVVWCDRAFPRPVVEALRGAVTTDGDLSRLRAIVRAHGGAVDVKTSRDGADPYKSFTRVCTTLSR